MKMSVLFAAFLMFSASAVQADEVFKRWNGVPSKEIIVSQSANGRGSLEMAPEVKTPDGKDISLKDFEGKYVLVDFWASWCGPCLREMPNVVKLYKECKGKNFEIFGVSLDNKKDAWEKAIKANGMKWPQGSDLKGWGSEPARLCNVSAIPFTVLIDPEGEVIAIDLRGEQLHAKVKEVLGKK